MEVNQDSAKKMASSIEKGIKDTKIDTSGISKQLAGSFNITDKNVISKLQSQMDKMISSLGKTWNGKEFDFGKASGFYSGMDSMVNTVMKNAKIVEGATGSYDAFFNYFKDKKIYVSDELKKAMGEDTYKELLQNNIGKIVRDASKGISIDSLWGEMRDLFPEHFSDNITNQVDQIVHAFDVLHQARADVGQVTTAQNMTAEQLTGISDSAAEQVVAIAAKLKESLQSNIMGASEAANSDSEDYGRIGTNSYKAAVDFIVPDTVDSQDAEAVSSYMSSIEHYFNHDEDGNRIGLDVQEFCAKATKAGLMELDEASGEYKVAGQKTMEDFAEGLNLSMPMVQAMFGEMEEFGGEFDWADEATKTLGDMAVAAGEAKGRIEEMSGDTDMNIQIDVSDIDNTEDKVKTLDNTISQMQNYKTTLDVDSSQVDDANAVIQYCVTQKQMLEAPAVMSVDTSQVDGELGNALSLLQQFQEAQNSVELQASVGADTSEAQGKVDSLVGEIQGLSPEIKATLGIDTTSADTLSASLQALSPEIMVKAGVDSSVVDAYAAEEKQSSGKVTWDNETGAVDAFAAQVHRSSGLVSWGNETSRVKTHFTATGTVNWTNTTPPTKGAGGANGTAHVSGTAHASGSAQYNHLSGHAQASGNWATKTGGTTLVGELGREIVVNPATGTWNTVGDNGAEFVNIPAGSIVFNHLQTEALLDRGFINSRGLAQASGSAMVRGGIPVKQARERRRKLRQYFWKKKWWHTGHRWRKSVRNTGKDMNFIKRLWLDIMISGMNYIIVSSLQKSFPILCMS